uniref:Cellulase n=1 Tax=Hanusia phi TaxID=3032 RepID=A0A7S0HLX9_9CRYP|mmetsp:Transcript_28195/g.63801  ORF Transcript_28195/g.63801 Transcript_28195/m.63801 type:complete len:388 (+) Transcript_28195:35-1198(+)
MVGVWILAALAALLVLPSSALYGDSCSSAADCKDARYPHCYIYWKDTTPTLNTISYTDSTPSAGNVQVKGVCVECMTDCDCPVNEYCGVGEFKIPKVTSSNAGTAGTSSNEDFSRLMKQYELYGMAFEGLNISSRCKKYDVPSSPCSVHYADTITSTVVSEKRSDGKSVTVARVSLNVLSRPLASSFCGRVNSWAPDFHPCAVSGGLSQDITRCSQGETDSDLSTKNMANVAAVCPRWAGYRDSTIGEVFADPACQANDATFSSGGYDFVSPSIDWSGYCNRGKCQICLEGSQRCQAPTDGGEPQICLNGKWQRARGHGMSPWDMPLSDLNIAAQSQLTSAVFASLCFAFVCFNAVVVWMIYRFTSGKRRGLDDKEEVVAVEKGGGD